MVFEPWQAVVDWFTYDVLGLSPASPAASALNFFIFDTVKIFILLVVIIFAITFIRSFFSPEKTRAWLAERRGSTVVGNVLAALLGIVTPFCSCSAVPLFIGFVEAGIPLGVTFSFLIAAPMVNEIALGMLWGLFGWQIALIYVTAGVAIAIAAGIVIGRLGMERYVEEYVYQIKVGPAGPEGEQPTLKERLLRVLGGLARHPEADLALRRDRDRDRRRDARLDPRRRAGAVRRAGQPALGDRRRADRDPALLERGRDPAARLRADPSRRGARHGTRVHDVRDGALAARDDPAPEGAQAAAPGGLRHGRRDRDHPVGYLFNWIIG